MSRPSSAYSPRLPSLPTLVVWLFLIVVAFPTTRSVYSLANLSALTVLYGLLAVALLAGARALATFGLAAKLGAALAVGVVLSWHLREQTRVAGTGSTLWTLEGATWFLTAATALAAVYLLIETLSARRRGGGPAARRFRQGLTFA